MVDFFHGLAASPNIQPNHQTMDPGRLFSSPTCGFRKFQHSKCCTVLWGVTKQQRKTYICIISIYMYVCIHNIYFINVSIYICIQHLYSHSRPIKPCVFNEKNTTSHPSVRPDAKRSLMKTKNFSLVI